MAEDQSAPVIIRIDEKLRRSISMDLSGCNIFKVPNQLRQTNEKAYEPYLFSIGPYHHGKDQLKAMEEHKIHFFKKLLQHRKESSAARYILALKGLEEEARKAYIEPLGVQFEEEEAFIEMMVVDGCFIIELIRHSRQQYYECGICRNLNMSSLKRDLLLVENQLPFFILLKLFKMTRDEDEEEMIESALQREDEEEIEFALQREDEEEMIEPALQNEFINMVINFFSETMPGPGLVQSGSIPRRNIQNIVGLVQSGSIPRRNIQNIVGLVHDIWLPSQELIDQFMASSSTNNDWNFIRTATALNDAGIVFKKIGKHKEEKISIFDIKFEEGVLRIPTIRIEDNTDSILRNMVAYEQCHRYVYPTYVTDYVVFMDSLINSKTDVELLCRAGIIENLLGDDKAVAGVFNKLGEHVMVYEDNFYADVFRGVREHSGSKWNEWKANLRHDYFKNPWSMISSLAAGFFLVLTLAQTVYTILSYYQ